MIYFPELDGDSSKLHKEKLVELFSDQFCLCYSPRKKVSIDQSLIGFEGGGPAIQYMPNKHHHRFGFKLFCLYKSSMRYVVNVIIYEAKTKQSHHQLRDALVDADFVKTKLNSEHGISYDISVDLMGPLFGMGYHFYTGNWYKSVSSSENHCYEKIQISPVLHVPIENSFQLVQSRNWKKVSE